MNLCDITRNVTEILVLALAPSVYFSYLFANYINCPCEGLASHPECPFALSWDRLQTDHIFEDGWVITLTVQTSFLIYSVSFTDVILYAVPPLQHLHAFDGTVIWKLCYVHLLPVKSFVLNDMDTVKRHSVKVQVLDTQNYINKGPGSWLPQKHWPVSVMI